MASRIHTLVSIPVYPYSSKGGVTYPYPRYRPMDLRRVPVLLWTYAEHPCSYPCSVQWRISVSSFATHCDYLHHSLCPLHSLCSRAWSMYHSLCQLHALDWATHVPFTVSMYHSLCLFHALYWSMLLTLDSIFLVRHRQSMTEIATADEFQCLVRGPCIWFRAHIAPDAAPQCLVRGPYIWCDTRRVSC